MNEKRRCQNAILPAVVFALTSDAMKLSKSDAEKESLFGINTTAFKIYAIYADSLKLKKRTSKAVNKILELFVDVRDGTYHIRKVILALYNVTQEAFDAGLIQKESAEVVQDALDLEGKLDCEEQDWLKLKASAEKRQNEILKIIKEI